LVARSRLIRLILEELEAAMTRDRARIILRASIGSFRTVDPEVLLAKADGPLRAALYEQLGVANGGLLADRICDVLLRHATSGIRTKTEAHGTDPAVSVGVLACGDADRTRRLIAGVEAIGFRAVTLGAARTLGATPAASWVNAFLITADLPLADIRDLAWWNAQRDEPAIVIVWPVENVTPEWGKALQEPMHLPEASFALLAKTLANRIEVVRQRLLREAGG
jgi:hypothetical protein